MSGMGGTIPAGTVIDGYTVPSDVSFVLFGKGTYSGQDVICTNGSFFIAWRDPTGGYVIAASDDPTRKVLKFGSSTYSNNATPQSYTFDGQTVYYNPNLNIPPYDPEPTTRPTVTLDSARIAWAMIYGGFGGYSVTYDLVNCTGDAGNPTNIPANAAVTNCDFILDETPDKTFNFTTASCWIDGTGFDGAPIQYVWEPETGHLKIGIVSSNIIVHVHATGDPYQDIDGDGNIPGGGAVPEPGLPGLSAASTGIMGLFCPTVAQMQQLSDFMWTDFGGQGTTVIEVLEEIVEAIKRAISNPLDYIFGLNIIPSQGLSIGGSKVVKFGFVSSGVSMPVLSDHYFIVDCGSVAFDVLCGDSFLDYAPYSKFSIYLPYIGFKDIDPNDCVGHTISVKYHGDAITGGLTAYVFKDGNVMYQYSGGCALNVPLSSDNWGATIASAASIATGVISAAASGGAAGVGVAAAKGAASVAANPSLLSPQVMHSGAVSGAPGFMGVQYPFIIREAVNFHSTAGFNKESGYPAYYYKNLSDVSGFTTVLDPHINNIPQATQGEMAEIISLLESGVIL